MATLTSNSSRVFNRQRVTVQIGNTRRQDFIPLQIIKRAGFTPDTALFLIPWARAVDDLSAFDYMLVQVFVDGSSEPLFRGYLSARTAEESPRVNRVVIQAVSITGYIDRLPIGWGVRRGESLYTKLDRVTDEDSGYTMADLMAGLEAITLDSNWAEAIRLGDVNVLKLTGSDLKPTTLRFTGDNYASGLRRILSYAPDVGTVERHTTEKTFLDFFKWGSFPGGVHTFRACDDDHEGPEDGAVITRVKWTSDDGGIYNRAIGYGAPYAFMVTFSTNHLTAPIVPAWSNASYWWSPELVTPAVDWDLTTAELGVLTNPRRADPASPYYVAGYDKIFKRYQLPPNIWRLYQKHRQNVLKVGTNASNQKHLDIQVFRRRWNLVENEDLDLVGQLLNWDLDNPDFEMVDGVVITEDGFLEFREPVVQDYIIQHDGTKLLKDRRPVDIFVTITISRADGIRPYYDTGVRMPIPLQNVGESGLVYTFVNNDVKVELVGAPTGAVVDWLGQSHAFGCIYYNETALQWQGVLAENAQIIRNDALWLGNIGERTLAERSKRRLNAEVEIPYLATAVDIGEGVQVLGRSIDSNVLTAVSIRYDMVNQRTMIQATDQVPRVVSGMESVGAGFGLANKLVSDGLTPGRYSDGTLPHGQMGPPLPPGYENATGFRDGVPDAIRAPDPVDTRYTDGFGNELGEDVAGPPQPRGSLIR